MMRKFSSVAIGMALAVAVLCLSDPRCSAEDNGLTEAQQRGQEIYRYGKIVGKEIGVRLQDSMAVSAHNFPCANCHGLEGEGQNEGGLDVPSLRWELLTAARPANPSLKARPPYTETSLVHAVGDGIGAAGTQLNPAMPHYRMNDQQFADVLAYLKVLGTPVDVDPGLSPASIRIGTVLPLTGPLALVGSNVQAVLKAYFDRLNSAGGIYGRKFELVVADSHGNAQGSTSALHELAGQPQVFALIANYIPNDVELDNQLAATQLPLVAPVSFNVRANTVERYRFDILPSFADQAKCLVTFAHGHQNQAKGTTTLYAVMHGDGAFDLDALSGFQKQITAFDIPASVELEYRKDQSSVAGAEAFLLQNKPDFVFFFGPADGLKTMLTFAIANKIHTRFLTATAMAGDLVSVASRDEAEMLWFAQPLLMNGTTLANLTGLEKASSIRISNLAIGATAYAAAEVFTEAVKRSGHRLSRSRLMASLELFQEFKTGFIAPITFGPNERAGATGCVITRIDPRTRRYVPITDWIAPNAVQ